MLAHGRRRVAYMVVKSLEPSEIEWDTLDPDNPKTWTNYAEDLRNAGLSEEEVFTGDLASSPAADSCALQPSP